MEARLSLTEFSFRYLPLAPLFSAPQTHRRAQCGTISRELLYLLVAMSPVVNWPGLSLPSPLAHQHVEPELGVVIAVERGAAFLAFWSHAGRRRRR